MEQAETRCILCDSTERSLLLLRDGWSVYRCDGCGLGVLDPRPDPEELRELYRNGYHESNYGQGVRLGSPEMRSRLSQETHRIRFFKRAFRRGRLLDIGCGMGYFLLACREAGYEVAGMDISSDAAAYVREELRIPVSVGTLEGIDYPPASFDVVTMWHFLEHVRGPAQYVAKARSWLKPDGVLVVDVPNYAGTDAQKTWERWKGWQLPFHLYHHTPHTLDLLLQKQGFRIIRRKHYLSEYVKERLERSIFTKPLARPIARLYSGHSFAVVARKTGEP